MALFWIESLDCYSPLAPAFANVDPDWCSPEMGKMMLAVWDLHGIALDLWGGDYARKASMPPQIGYF